MRKPSLALPEPLRAAEDPSFTNYSVLVRLPDIARQTLSDNQFSPEITQRIRTLIDEIPNGPVRPLRGIPSALGWDEYARPYLGMDWLEIPWFFAEEYFYLRMVEAVEYFTPGPHYLRDPYARQKQLGLHTSRAAVERLAAEIDHALALPDSTRLEMLGRMLLADLWGNQNDLSMWPVQHDEENGPSGGAPEQAPEHASAQDFLLSNDIPALLSFLERDSAQGKRIDIILDNAGYELVADLALTDLLLSGGLAARVKLHTKAYPVFVSDALVNDIHATVDWLRALPDPAHSLGERLAQALHSGALTMGPHPFWTSPLPAWELPADLAAETDQAHLLISKGDANYRRLLGDLHWPVHTPFASVVDYFPPALLALRTLKSEIAVGIPLEHQPQNDPKWMYSGRYGVIQFSPPQR